MAEKLHNSLDTPQTWWIKSSSLEEQKNTQDSRLEATKLTKIHTFLESIDDPNEDKYKEKLLKLDKASLGLLLEQPQTEIVNVLNKAPIELNQYLIQNQIKKIENKSEMTKDDKRLRYNLKKQLIALENNIQETENNKQAKQRETIADQNSEIKSAYNEVNSNLLSIKGSLDSLKGQNKNVNKIFALLNNVEKYNIIPDGQNDNELKIWTEKMNEKLNQIIQIFKNPVVLHSISKDLKEYDRENGTKTYENFKSTVLEIDPSVNFERVEIDFVANMAKMKLWADNVNGVNLESGVLQKTENWITKEYSEENWRFLSDGKYKYESELDPKFENELLEIDSKITEEIAPINKKLNFISWILNYIQNAKISWADFEETKAQIKNTNPELYSEMWLENSSNFEEFLFAINQKKLDLEEEAEAITDLAKREADEIVRQSVKEADEKDKLKITILQFFNSIWVSNISQTKFEQVIVMMNINPWAYWLQHPIDIENWNLWFDKDFWDKEINPVEKREFIKLFNKMLWEDIVNENIANGTTTLSLEARSRIQKLNNKTTGFFMGNLNKQK